MELTTKAEARGASLADEKRVLKLGLSEYDRTRPLIDGRIRPAGIAFDVETGPTHKFCREPVHELYDVTEMSFSWYLMARDRGEPVIALPVFPLRMAVLGYVFVRSDSGITKPSELAGKRIVLERYRFTCHIWLRGLFEEFYGISPSKMRWITAAPEGAAYEIPPDIDLEMIPGSTPATTAEEHLKSGLADALFTTKQPPTFLAGETWIRRLFPDAQTETHQLVERTGIVPITHTLVMNEKIARDEPQVVRSVFDAFVASQEYADQVLQGDPKMLSLIDAVFIRDQQRAAYGSNPYVSGMQANRRTVEAFVRYAYRQGYISREIPVDELFPAQLLAT